ncbi:General transcription factor IIH subunit 3 [Oopsacas minuta]|uniref:General transcription factor IIH subunit 3 n=1 Tax=Oopsacas minuta TaxID=111878 RepID=A0AAV7KLM1_9METZ|nr:General transcription factor IIH subunit 3 [Oopsacas minuta]
MAEFLQDFESSKDTVVEVNYRLLLVIIETSSSIWAGQGRTTDSLSLQEYLETVIVFINSFLSMDRLNRVLVLAAHNNASYYLYPSAGIASLDTKSLFDSVDMSGVSSAIITNSRKLLAETCGTLLTRDVSGLPSALARSLCYANKFKGLVPPGVRLLARALVINSSPVDSSQYMTFMNASFAAQKESISIDTCLLIEDSSLLQQVTSITGGLYLRKAGHSALLQYLLWFYLPEVEIRDWFLQPPKSSVDTRASCCCHGDMTELGHICSVCFSVYCKFTPICHVCETAFKLPQLGIKK